MTEHEEMEVFLREIQMNIESDQKKFLMKKDSMRNEIESLKREKLLIEEKLKDNISFFNPSSAKNREKLESIDREILEKQQQLVQLNETLEEIHKKVNLSGNVLAFIRENSPVEEEEVTKDNFTTSGVSILEAQEMERKRIARDLHDSTVQSLTNIVHKTEYCSKMVDKDPLQVKFELMDMMDRLHEAIDDMRRIIYDLRPMSIDDLGFVPTIQRFIQQNKKEHENMEFEIKVTSESDEVDLPPVVTLTLFRIIQEACNNIFKYSEANHVTISIHYGEEEIELEIADDGVGFDKNEIGKDKKSSGFGLSIMQERAQLLCGEFSIQSEIGNGTSVLVSVPYTVLKEISLQKAYDLR